jgi:hypothetical protein
LRTHEDLNERVCRILAVFKGAGFGLFS